VAAALQSSASIVTTKFACSVLLMDDEPSITTPVSGYLRRLGWLTQVAAEVEEALALVMQVEEIRRLSPATRIVVLSAFVDEEAEAEARRRGADAVLRKPQPLAALARVGHLLIGLSHA
jgi:CheY-like chemotaxis protein